MSECTCTRMYRGQRSLLGFVLQEPSTLSFETLFFDAESLTGCWDTQSELDGLAFQPLGSACLQHPSAQITSMYRDVFTGVPGIEVNSLCLCGKHCTD